MIRHKKDKVTFFEQGVISEKEMLAFLSNELTAEEKQKFETLLKDDPFAQDALEGLQNTQSQAAVSTAVSNLNKKVRERSGLKEQRGIQLHWTTYAYAAALVGLLISIAFVMVTYLGKHNEQVAMTEKVKTEQSLFEEKSEKTSLVPAEGNTVNDSVAVPSPTTAAPVIVAPTGNSAADISLKGIAAKETPVTSVAAANKGTTNQTTANTNTTLTTSAKTTAPVTNNVAADSKALPPSAAPIKQAATDLQKAEKKEVAERGEEKKAGSTLTIEEAMRSFNSGDYKKSSQQFEDILRSQPKNDDALYFGGISSYINGDMNKSEKNFDKLLKGGAKFIDGSKWYKANILLQKGKKEEAKRFLNELSESGSSYKERALKKKLDAGL